jgi:acetoacetyl-CoA synthetase
VQEQVLWSPSSERIKSSQMEKFKNHINARFDLNLSSYKEMHFWSINEPSLFWSELISYFGVKFDGNIGPATTNLDFSSYGWFPNVRLNFAENLLKNGKDENVALQFSHESGLGQSVTYKELRTQVGYLQGYLKNYLKQGDVLAAYMPNIPETIMSMLATTALGGVFTSTSSDFGVAGVLDRFGQSKPKVIVAAIGYEYGGKYFDLHDRLVEIEKTLIGVERIIIVDFLNKGVDLSRFKNAVLWSEAKALNHELTFNRIRFQDPLYIMYSSGTTGKPKCIVHGNGGVLLQHIKELALHSDLKEEKTISFFTTCGWMMWNWLVSSLYFGSKIVLYEGSPAHPSPQAFFEIINREKINIFGTSPKFLKAMEDTNAKFENGFPTLETILSTGSPLLPEQYDYVYRSLKKDVLLASISGGTDVLGCFMLGSPTLPVYRGEIQCIGLGMDVAAFDEFCEPVVDKEGELVCRKSFPSRPLSFLNDNDNELINAAYFNQNKGVWTHGDYVKISHNGTVTVYGRSDATLNPGGVRIGTSEIYRQTENLPFIADALCVGKPVQGDVEVLLFLKLKPNEELTTERKKQIKDLIKKNTTPRHVPKDIFVVTDIPYTRSGKKVELAVTKILSGKPVTNVEALANPESLKEFEKYKI